MRNIDYGLYQQVLEAEHRVTGMVSHRTREQLKEINSNKARHISVNQAKLGKGGDKKEVEDPTKSDARPRWHDVWRLITEGFAWLRVGT